MLEAEIRGLLDLQAKTDQVIEDLHGKPMLGGMRRATMLVRTEAQRLSPVDRGELRASITPDVRMEGFTTLGVVGSNKLHAPYQETGTKPHWVPREALEVWARRHGIDVYLVQRAIARHGTKARRYLQGAFEAKRDEVQREIGKTVTGIVEK